MQKSKNMLTILIAFLLLSSIAVTCIDMPNVEAASSLQTYPVIGATPNPVGVGQETLILIGITQATTSSLYGWEKLTITVTKPDGTTQTLGPYKTDSTGLTGAVYVPDTVGNYTLQLHFPEQEVAASIGGFFGPSIPKGTIMKASDSIKITLVVQEERTPSYPSIPLPTEYWTRPVDDQLREWSSIDGNWLQTPPNFLAYGNEYAPQSAHILWTTPLTSGGQVGGTLDPSVEALTQASASGQSGQVGYDTGDAYEGKWGGSFGGGAPIAMGGKIYYTEYAAGDPYKNLVCVDIHTGNKLWTRVLPNNATLTRGQVFYWQTMDFYGAYDYLWATSGGFSFFGPAQPATWTAFDPYTGDWAYTITNVPGGTTIYGPHGELLVLTLNSNGWMTMWNSTNIPAQFASNVFGSMGWAQWRPMGKTLNGTGPANVVIDRSDGLGSVPYNSPETPLGLAGYSWNVTIPTNLPGSVLQAVAMDKIVGGYANTTDVMLWALNLNPSKGTIGQLLYQTDWKAPSDWLAGNQTIGFGTTSIADKTLTVNAKESRMRYGFSTEDGSYKWQISEPIAMLGHLTGGPSGENGYIVYGMLICGTMSGTIQAYAVTDGKLAWTYNVKDPYMQTLWSNNWPVGHLIAAGGKIYFANLEHSANQPLPRGGPFVCLNATTGEEIWRANGLFRQTVWGGRAIIGDSIIATMDTYDQRVYGIGRGPSATSVVIQDDVITFGNQVLIQGKVTDVSPGLKDTVISARFPNGVPAVSDESESDWMLYVYKQFPKPTNATGVDVKLSVFDPNGNTYDIGTAISDASGSFSLMWQPPVPGKYVVIAQFQGTNSYYPSFGQTAVGVTDAPATPTPQPEIVLPPTEMYVIGVGVAIIVAVAIVGALMLIAIRKRP